MMSCSRNLVRSPACTGWWCSRNVIVEVCQFTTMLMSNEQGNAGQFAHTELSESPAILCRQVGQIVGELIQPIDARTGAWKSLC